MATETRETLKNLLLDLVKDIDKGGDLNDIASELVEASDVAEEIAASE